MRTRIIPGGPPGGWRQRVEEAKQGGVILHGVSLVSECSDVLLSLLMQI